jgi:hypothetical protein
MRFNLLNTPSLTMIKNMLITLTSIVQEQQGQLHTLQQYQIQNNTNINKLVVQVNILNEKVSGLEQILKRT